MADQNPNAEIELKISAVLEAGKRLAIRCQECGRFRYINASRFSPNQSVSDVGKQLTCSACRSKKVDCVVISKNPENGFWPAESS